MTKLNWKKIGTGLRHWVDNGTDTHLPAESPAQHSIDWPRVIPYVGLHLACLAVIWVGWSPVAVTVAAVLYFARMFFVTAFYHRYFAHKAFRASRPMQTVFAVLGNTAVQRGPLWWAAHHRVHHRHADAPEDSHSPRHHGFLWSHSGWFLSRANFATRWKTIPDLAKYPELRFLDRFDTLIPIMLAVALFGLGEWLAAAYPALGTNGWQMLVWGFCISTVVLFHATFTVNSLAHRIGKRRYATGDDSRNNFWLALITLGEGWHNNHHHYPGSARQGFFWWEIDVTYYLLCLMQSFGLIHSLRDVPEHRRAALASN